MKYSESALNILTIRTYPQKGPAWINQNIRGNEDLSILYHLLKTNEYEFLKKRERIESAINLLGNNVDGLVTIGDVDFPPVRGIVKPADKPFALFYKGNIDLLSKYNLNVAVIGVLNPDDKIELTERMVTTEILKHNATIVSGLALGCDSIAHKTALEKGGKTIAILPSTHDNILPKENIELAERIVNEGGLLISEYYEPPKSKNDMISRFVVRDRLQALFSDAVLLAASYAPNNFGNDCGSRHAMAKAKAYGIKRGVIYNDSKHRNIAMYDLNRQILIEDNSVIRIDSGNMSEAVLRLVTKSNDQILF
ncbi:MAG: DNA-processing protein DprA [Bacteroidetes bacterium]|uniref:DNA-processing protein DprA n=1 Tax=Candidatus Gallipaludibacter merdavium TaxID=2840839 RepID=A0A9D9HS72_9BACT|nr:DNA-processing protein DprA [Candidatus Gallipaludibacter merdavium]